MPYFSHDSFKDFMSTMDAAWIKKYMRALLTALDHLHQHKVMHRDIKPGNFLYSRRTDQFLLVDFGLAHFQLEDEEDQQTKKRKREDDEEDASRAAKRQKLSSSQSRLTIPTPVANDPNQRKEFQLVLVPVDSVHLKSCCVASNKRRQSTCGQQVSSYCPFYPVDIRSSNRLMIWLHWLSSR